MPLLIANKSTSLEWTHRLSDQRTNPRYRVASLLNMNVFENFSYSRGASYFLVRCKR